MLIKILSTLAVVCLLFCVSAAAQTTADNRIGFTVPEAPWTLTLDGKNFVVERRQIKPDGKNGYFLMTNETDKLTASLFIEPAAKCKTAKECRDMVLKLGNPAWEGFKNLTQSEIGEASAFEFLLPTFQGQPIRQQNLYAEFVKDGYWVDFHVSKVLYKKEDRALFEALVKSIKFEVKPDKPEVAAQKAIESWTTLWDAGKYDETYELLAENTKKSIDKKKWFVYWSAVRKPLGKLKSRQLVKAEYQKSLAGLPDQEGAFVQYKSSFDTKESVGETFVVIHEKDGAWRVANYLAN